MDEIDLRYGLIEEHEQTFAKGLACRIIPRPELSIWMVLIPIIFVFYFYQRERYRTGSEEFRKHYLVSRKRALDAARSAMASGEDPDLGLLAKTAQVPHSAAGAYAGFMQVLIDHYQVLLESEGATYPELLRAAYDDKTNYLLFCNELSQAEKDLNAALAPQLAATAEGYGETAAKVEEASEEMRREEADRIFASCQCG